MLFCMSCGERKRLTYYGCCTQRCAAEKFVGYASAAPGEWEAAYCNDCGEPGDSCVCDFCEECDRDLDSCICEE